MDEFHAALAQAPADLATAIDKALCLLVRRGAELGALELDAAVGPDGDWCECRVPPRIWFERLARAVEVGAFERLKVEAIVDRILLPPLPGD